MPFKSIIPGLYNLTRGGVNVFLIDAADGLTFIDTGVPSGLLEKFCTELDQECC